MKLFDQVRLVSVVSGILASASAFGATVLVNDNYNVTGTGSGFALNTGVNSGINPPTTLSEKSPDKIALCHQRSQFSNEETQISSSLWRAD